jgi:hypothetical protein
MKRAGPHVSLIGKQIFGERLQAETVGDASGRHSIL